MLGVPKPCKYCGSDKHYPYQCFNNPKKHKTLNRNGKYGKQWLVTRASWFKKHLPDPEPYPHYVCYICGKWLHPEETTLDHVLSRGRHPELRAAQWNLKPCCFSCNEAKGSKDGTL